MTSGGRGASGPTPRVCVIGAGAWGTTLANLLAGSGVEVRLWALEPDVASSIRDFGENTLFLQGVPLERTRLSATNSLSDALDGAEVVVWRGRPPSFRPARSS